MRVSFVSEIAKGLVLAFGLLALLSGCAVGLAMEELVVLRAGLAEAGASRAFLASGSGVAIANEASALQVLNRVGLQGSRLIARSPNGVNKPFGRLISASEVEIDSYGRFPLPRKVYTVKGDWVKFRASPSMVNDHNVLYHKTTGQLVFLLDQKNGWAYVQDFGSRTLGWISMAYLALAATEQDHPDHQSVRFELCGACKGMGHATVNINCHVCRGKGSINCGYCSGQSLKPCYACGQSGRLTCFQCNGKGSRPCERCAASGYETDALGIKSTCTYCIGAGKLPCYDCKNAGSTKCYDCNGLGNITCNYCQGSGKDVCYQCFQTGTVRLSDLCSVCLGTGWRKFSK